MTLPRLGFRPRRGSTDLMKLPHSLPPRAHHDLNGGLPPPETGLRHSLFTYGDPNKSILGHAPNLGYERFRSWGWPGCNGQGGVPTVNDPGRVRVHRTAPPAVPQPTPNEPGNSLNISSTCNPPPDRFFRTYGVQRLFRLPRTHPKPVRLQGTNRYSASN